MPNARGMDTLVDNPDIARAIRRSSAARTAMQSSRRRRLTIMVAVALALGGGTALTVRGLTGGDPLEAAVNSARSLVDLLEQRSPGERTKGLLTKTKRSQRALAKTRPAVNLPLAGPAPSATELAKLLLPPIDEEPLPVAVGAPLALTELPTPFDSIAGPGGGILVAPSGGGGSPGGGTPPIVTPQNPGLPSAVPEPGSWAMMLLGFALIGWRARRGAASTATPLQA
jgi:hypothetical protein